MQYVLATINTTFLTMIPKIFYANAPFLKKGLSRCLDMDIGTLAKYVLYSDNSIHKQVEIQRKQHCNVAKVPLYIYMHMHCHIGYHARSSYI